MWNLTTLNVEVIFLSETGGEYSRIVCEFEICEFEFYVLLTVRLGIIFVNNQLDAQLFFMYVYFYSLHVSGSHVPIVRRINLLAPEFYI